MGVSSDIPGHMFASYQIQSKMNTHLIWGKHASVDKKKKIS